MRRVLPIFLVVALAIVLALHFGAPSVPRAWPGGVDPAAREAPVERARPAAEHGQGSELIVPATSSPEPARRLSVRGDVRARNTASFGPELRERTISGSVEVFDSGGYPVEARGSFYLAFQGGERLETRPVAFAGPTWSVTLDVSDAWTALTIRVPQVGGRAARVVEPSADLPFPLDGPLAVVLTVPRTALLRVVDAVSGLDLEQVCIEPVAGVGRHGAGLGAACSVPLCTSPVLLGDLPTRGESAHLRVGAAGYAEREIWVDREHGGERWVALEAGADLRVEVELGSIPEDLGLFVREVGALQPVRLEMVRRGGTFRFSGLRPGAYRVALELVPLFTRIHAALPALAEREIDLVAGRRAEVRLICGPEPDLRPAPAAGIVRVPASFEGKTLELAFRPLGLHGPSDGAQRRVQAVRAPRADGASVDFAWSLPELEVDAYRIDLYSLGHMDLLQQPPGGRLDFLVDMTGLLELRVVDPALDPLVPTPMLSWFAGPADGPEMRRERHAFWRPEQGAWVLYAPPGPVVIRPPVGWGATEVVRAERETIDLRTDGQVHTLRTRGRPALTVRLSDGRVPVEVPRGSAVRLHPRGGAGDVHEVGVGAFERRFRTSGPGTYTLEVQVPLGYRPIAPLPIVLEPGADRTLTLELERTHP